MTTINQRDSNGLKQGLWILNHDIRINQNHFDPTGSSSQKIPAIWEINYKDNRLDGLTEVYDSKTNRILLRERYADNQLHGYTDIMDPDTGHCVSSTPYKRSKINGDAVYSDRTTGRTFLIVHYQDGKSDGLAKEFTKDGRSFLRGARENEIRSSYEHAGHAVEIDRVIKNALEFCRKYAGPATAAGRVKTRKDRHGFNPK